MKTMLKVVPLALAALAARADTAFKAGEWEVAFAAEGQSLKLTHAASGAEVVGELMFMGPDRATDAKAEAKREWKIVDARDGVPHRLALVDRNNDAQGYLTFQSNGAQVSFLVYHRTALAYRGELSYTGEIKYREDAFAAATFPLPGERVLQLASGDADSL